MVGAVMVAWSLAPSNKGYLDSSRQAGSKGCCRRKGRSRRLLVIRRSASERGGLQTYLRPLRWNS